MYGFSPLINSDGRQTGQADWVLNPAQSYRHGRELGLEKIVSVRAGNLYRSGTSRTWLKSKNPGFAWLMPRDGAVVLSDLRNPTLSIVCEPCGRRGTYNVARLIEQHRDAKLTDLLQTLANCPKARSASIHDRCKAVFGQPLP
jgi:hypothetical protein